MFPNYENLTVEQLLQQQINLKQKLTQAAGSGMGPQITEQLQNMLEFINSELQSKVEVEKFNAAKQENDGDPNDGTSLDIGSIE